MAFLPSLVCSFRCDFAFWESLLAAERFRYPLGEFFDWRRALGAEGESSLDLARRTAFAIVAVFERASSTLPRALSRRFAGVTSRHQHGIGCRAFAALPRSRFSHSSLKSFSGCHVIRSSECVRLHSFPGLALLKAEVMSSFSDPNPAEEWKPVEQNILYLSQNLKIDCTLLYGLMEETLLTIDEKKECDSIESSSKQVEWLLFDILRKKGPGSFAKFCKVLRSNKKEFIADRLCRSESESKTVSTAPPSTSSRDLLRTTLPCTVWIFIDETLKHAYKVSIHPIRAAIARILQTNKENINYFEEFVEAVEDSHHQLSVSLKDRTVVKMVFPLSSCEEYEERKKELSQALSGLLNCKMKQIVLTKAEEGSLQLSFEIPGMSAIWLLANLEPVNTISILTGPCHVQIGTLPLYPPPMQALSGKYLSHRTEGLQQLLRNVDQSALDFLYYHGLITSKQYDVVVSSHPHHRQKHLLAALKAKQDEAMLIIKHGHNRDDVFSSEEQLFFFYSLIKPSDKIYQSVLLSLKRLWGFTDAKGTICMRELDWIKRPCKHQLVILETTLIEILLDVEHPRQLDFNLFRKGLLKACRLEENLLDSICLDCDWSCNRKMKLLLRIPGKIALSIILAFSKPLKQMQFAQMLRASIPNASKPTFFFGSFPALNIGLPKINTSEIEREETSNSSVKQNNENVRGNLNLKTFRKIDRRQTESLQVILDNLDDGFQELNSAVLLCQV